MTRRIAFMAICGLLGLMLVLSACNGFFVSPTSVGSISVSPTSSLLLVGGTPQPLAVTATLVNGNSGGDVTSSSTCTSSNKNVIVLDSSIACQFDAVGAGSAYVTISHSGATSVTVPFVVVTNQITTITLTAASSTISTSGSTYPSTAQLAAVAENQNITSFVTWNASGGGLSVSSSGVLSASTTLTQTNGTVYASLNNSATGGTAVNSNTLTITVNP